MTNYFEDAIATGQPIVPPAPVTPPVLQPVNQSDVQTIGDVRPVQGEWQGLPVRAVGDRIFLLKNGKRSWITTKEVYERLGFKFGDEVKIDQATLDVIPEGEPIR